MVSAIEANRNIYAHPRNNIRTEMYAGRIVCCPLVSHVEYTPRALLNRQFDGSYTDTLGLHLGYRCINAVIFIS